MATRPNRNIKERCKRHTIDLHTIDQVPFPKLMNVMENSVAKGGLFRELGGTLVLGTTSTIREDLEQNKSSSQVTRW